ncbi:hypothetical protein GCM10011387_27800 [Pedobacter quisquiliarum]|uniref:DUF5977 domain-containing protein n=1 Tax=Pedobacter quisquiliarum TaxID=1834438 RepID=A0A916UH18_9SPHI|nr:hypothetical protein GCM10011387_27800 [Pedobacter quisquiliarum]
MAAIEKYGNFEVNLFHGVPEIVIPLFDLKSKKFDIPINLSYHASGVKVSDVASWVGLGWSLNVGGQISRSVKGKDDLRGILRPDYQLKTPAQVNPNTFDGYLYLKSLSTNDQDGEPDVFSYSVPGKFGNFLYKNSTTPVLIPSEPVRITRDLIPEATSHLFRFNMLDEQGNNYLFGKKLNGESVVELSTTELGGKVDTYASSWLLTHMISADKSDTVSFDYQSADNVQLSVEGIDNVSVTDNIWNDGTTGCCEIPPPPPSSSIQNTTTSSNFSVNQRLLQKIEFPRGKVEFLTLYDRNDLSARSLDHINVYAKDNLGAQILLKNIHFFYSYFGSSPSSRLRLDSIIVSRYDYQDRQTYRFTYNDQPNHPNFKKAQDYWGYYNGEHNSTLVPRTIIPYRIGVPPSLTNTAQIGDANRAPNPNVVQSNILKRIQYPTGGYTIFNYEPNKFSSSVRDTIGGGVRIQSILTYPSLGAEPIIKSYKYGTFNNKESGTGLLNTLKTLYFTPTRTSSYVASPPYQTTSDNTVYSSNISYSINEYDDSNVFYPFVTEYIGTPEVNLGKKVHEFSMASDIPVINNTSGIMPQVQSNHWKRGKLLNLKEYEKLNGPNYKLKKEISNYYTSIKPETVSNIGLNVVQSFVLSGLAEPFYYSGNFPRPYSYSFYNLYTGAYLPTSSTEKTYGTSKNLETYTEYKYNNSFQPSIIKNLKSNGDTLITKFKYADDYNASVSTTSGSGIKNLQNLNAVSFPIEKTVSVKVPSGLESVVGGELKTYYDNRQLLKDEYRLETDQPISGYQASSINGSGLLTIPSVFKKRISYTSYDANGNALEYLVDNKRKNAFIWDRKQSYLIAEVQNAGSGQIAYTSFEYGSKGNWTYNESGTQDVFPFYIGVVGEKVYDFAKLSEPISKSGLSQEPYVVSYWGKKSCSVNGSGPTTTNAANSHGWMFFTHTVTPINGIITLTSSDAIIDELRLHPASAMMNTYLHEPLVGVKATGQSNGNFNVFEYDSFQRLLNEKDHNLAITKNYKYNIPTPRSLGGLPIIYTNTKLSGTFIKNNCSSQYYGTTVKYEIEEGSFFSTVSYQDAQNKATAALTANGQQYANANGKCRLKTEVIWEPVESYCQIKQLNVAPPSTSGYGLINIQSAPNTTNFTTATIVRPYSNFAVKVNYVFYMQSGKQFFGSINLEAGEMSKTFTVSLSPYTNEMRNGGDVVSIELYNNLYQAGTIFYEKRQKKVGGQVVLTEPNLKGVGEGPYYDVVRGTIPGYSSCQGGYVMEIPFKVAYANTDLSIEFQKVCPSGQIGSRVYYQVPAGKYTSSISQADADAKAMAEANANGQSNANTKGTCF